MQPTYDMESLLKKKCRDEDNNLDSRQREWLIERNIEKYNMRLLDLDDEQLLQESCDMGVL